VTDGAPVDPEADHGSERPAPDPIDALRAELEDGLDQLPVADRVARFERANDVLARELAVLDEV
jgi:hypothetical protein